MSATLGVIPAGQVFEREQKLRLLATELVKNIREADDVLADFGLTREDYEALQGHHEFVAMLRQAHEEWSSLGNTRQRIVYKAQTVIEASLAQLFTDLTDKAQPLSSRVGLMQALAKVGQLGNPEAVAGAGGGQTFRLEINLGTTGGILPTTQTVVIEAQRNDEPQADVFQPDRALAEEALMELA